MDLVDVHCHLDHVRFKATLAQVLERAKTAGVKVVIANGVNTLSNREVLALAKADPIIKVALGMYPLDALGVQIPALDEVGLARQNVPIDVDAEIGFIEQHKNDIVALGEVGLDFKYVKEPHLVKAMEDAFRKIIDLGERLRKPLLVHSRNAERRVLEMLQSSKAKAVLHCFSGSKKLIQKASDAGYTFSIPPVITRLQHFQMLAGMVPIGQLLTETDSPWLSPVVGQFNEPANVTYSIKKIAEAQKLTEEETANHVFLNYQRMFG